VKAKRSTDVDLLSNLDRIIHFDAEVADRALDLRMSKKQLDGAQVARAAIDQNRLRSPQRVRAELGWIESDAGHPFVDETRVLPRREPVRSIATTGEQELAEFRPMSLRYSSTAERVWSVSSNRAGLPVFLCLMVARRVLNESLFFGIGHAHSAIAAWVADYNTARPHSSLGYATPADFARIIAAIGPDAAPDDSSASAPVAHHTPHATRR